MVDDNTVKEESPEQQRILIAIASLLIVAIVGLVVGIVVVKMKNETQDCATLEDGGSIASCVVAKYPEAERLEAARSAAETAVKDADAEETVEIYQALIEKMKAEGMSDEGIAELYTDEVWAVTLKDMNFTEGDAVIAAAIEADGYYRSLDSATVVYNMASAYSNQEVLLEYAAIIYERAESEGAELNLETKG